MKGQQYKMRFWKNITLMVVLCLMEIGAQAQLYIPMPFAFKEEKEITVEKSGGEYSLDFYLTGQPSPAVLANFTSLLNGQLARFGITWITVKSLIWKDYEVNNQLQPGTAVLLFEGNNTGKIRTVILKSASTSTVSCTLKQLAGEVIQDQISSFFVSSDCPIDAAFPGRKTIITLSGSQVGVSYYIGNDTLQGTGDALVFEQIFTEGYYFVKAQKGSEIKTMNGRVDISYYPFLKAGLCTEEKIIKGILPILKPFPGCGFASVSIPFINLMSDAQVRQLDDMLDQINRGKSNCYPGFRVIRNGSNLALMTGPNINKEEWTSEVFLSLANGGNGKVFCCSVLLMPMQTPVAKGNLLERSFESLSDYSLKLDSWQLAVKYKLFKDGVLVQEKYSDMGPVIFEHLSGGGTYYVEAHYYNTVTRMNGEVFIDGGIGSMSYVKENVYSLENAPVSTYVYYDGLGREVQTRQVKAGAGGKDLVTLHVYDSKNREPKTFLPYSISTTGFRQYAATEQANYYQQKFGTNPYAYAENVYANLPEDRVIESSSPGYEMRLGGGHTTKSDVRKNRTTDPVKRFLLSGTSLTLSGNYPANSLMVYTATDAEGKVALEYKDAEEHVVCKSESGVSSYYVYDELGQLRYIVPPLQDSLFTSGTKTLSELSQYCYYMEYDSRGRVYKRYVPGAGYTLTLYDLRDRPVFVQDARQRVANQWHFTKYDIFDRPVIAGLCTGSESELTTALAAQTVFGEERGTALHGYTNVCPPVNATASNCLNITYYDDYSWAGQSAVAFSLADTLGVLQNDKVKGQVTGNKTKVLGASPEQWLTSALYYDRYYRTIQSVSQLYKSGKEVTSNRHDFGGHVIQVKVRQEVGNVRTGYTKYMDYDSYGRVLSVRQRVDGDVTNGEVVLARYEYDDLGRASKDMLHNGRDTVVHRYDLQGREIARTSTNFSYEVGFEKTESSLASVVTPRYNGNISHLKWGAGKLPDKGYTYAYDTHGQLTAAAYLQRNGSSWSRTTKYAEKDIRYDRNGNLKFLRRTDGSGGELHVLEYAYGVTGNGNAISSIKQKGVSSGTYEYDANGNMTKDGRRGVTITYNELNLPSNVSRGSENISYIYSADGQKLAGGPSSSLTYYRDVMVYDHNNNLSYIVHPLGLIRKSGSGYVYDYFLKDHLGSTRVMVEASGNRLTNVQTTDYYPYGLAFTFANLSLNKYLYSGKEFQDASLGGELLGLYDFGSRFYDPMLGRWFCQDPALQLMSPYGYCGNDPIAFVDPDGEFLLGFATGFIRGLFKGHFFKGRAFQEGWKSAINEEKIRWGLFKSGGDKNIFQKVGEVASRLTWQLPQTVLGYSFSQFVNYTSTTKVDYYAGTTTVSSSWLNGTAAVTLGSYINGSHDLKADPDNVPFQHEYGHYLQSQKWGWGYLAKAGLPSLLSAAGNHRHKYYTIEQDANARALKYFNKRGVLKKWDFDEFPIGTNDWRMENIYKDGTHDFTDEFSMALGKARTHSTIWNFVSAVTPVSLFVTGLVNHKHHSWVNEISK